MYGLIQRHLLPSESNGYHPAFLRLSSLFIVLVVLSFVNLILFPGFNNKAKAFDISIEKVVELTNKKRIENGFSPLKKNSILEKAAFDKLKDMFQKQYWDHYGPNGESPWIFMKQNGYEYLYAGENLAKDFTRAEDLIDAWMKSPTHRRNILNDRFQEIGIAILDGNLNGKSTILVVQFFGTPKKDLAKEESYYFSIENYAPSIIKPSDNSILGQRLVEIIGESRYGNAVKVYSNNQIIGEIPVNGGVFSQTLEIYPGENILRAQSIDLINQKKSLLSSPIKVIFDNNPPDTSKVNLETFLLKDKLLLVVRCKEDITKIKVNYGKGEDFLNLHHDTFFGEIPLSNRIILHYYDRAGNLSMTEHNLDELPKSTSVDQLPPFIVGYINTRVNSPGILANISISGPHSLKNLINLLILGVLCLIVVLDGLILIKKNIHRHHSTHHSINIPTFLIIGLIILTI